MKIPRHWFDMLSGDMVATKIPLHRIESYTKAMKADGYEFTIDPIPTGYMLTCTKSPHDAMLKAIKRSAA